MHFSVSLMEKADAQTSRPRVSDVPTRDAHKKATSSEMASTLGLYVLRWRGWAVAGLQGIDGLYSCIGFTFADSDQTYQSCTE